MKKPAGSRRVLKVGWKFLSLLSYPFAGRAASWLGTSATNSVRCEPETSG
jgi:hypothetical protein